MNSRIDILLSTITLSVLFLNTVLSNPRGHSPFENGRWQRQPQRRQGWPSPLGSFHQANSDVSLSTMAQSSSLRTPNLNQNRNKQPISSAHYNPPTLIPQPRPLINQSSEYEYSHREVLDSERYDTLEWEVDWSSNSITFTISVQTSSYVTLGLSKKGEVAGADTVVGGVRSNGESFIVDMHGVDNRTIAQDQSQDWRLINVQMSAGEQTILSVSRNLDTCDPWQDMIINNDLLYIIYDYGYGYQPYDLSLPSEFHPQGSIRAYLLDPVNSRPPEQSVQNWRLSRRIKLQNRHTSYWCTIHRGLSTPNKNHIVGYTPYFGEDDRAKKYIHHQLVYRCFAPSGTQASSVFEQFVNHRGEECYLEETHQLPTILCSEVLHIYGIGGDKIFNKIFQQFLLPSDVGIPIGGENEYYMYETHFNRELDDIDGDVIIDSGVDFHYTPQLRRDEGTIFFQGHGVFGLFMVPPESPDFSVVGHCSPQCTRELIPPSEVEIVATLLHAHTATRKVRAKQYRDNKELPWILSDDNFDWSYQAHRLLLLCDVFFIVNKRIPLLYCTSEMPLEWYLSRYGIQNMTWDVSQSQRIVNAASNPSFVGRTFTQVVDETDGIWTPAQKMEIARSQYFGEQAASCPNNDQFALLAYTALNSGSPSLLQQITDTRPSTRTMGAPPQGHTVSFPAGATLFDPTQTCPEPRGR